MPPYPWRLSKAKAPQVDAPRLVSYLGPDMAVLGCSRVSSRLCALLAGSCLSACGGFSNSPDSPNKEDRGTSAARRVSLWTVEDADSGAVLGSGCHEEDGEDVPSVTARVGTKLVFEVIDWSVTKDHFEWTPGFWCSDEAFVSKAMFGWVRNLACFDFPADRGIKTLSWEPVEIGRVVAPPMPDAMSGDGYRLELEVEAHPVAQAAGHAGLLFFVPNGTCKIGAPIALEVREPG
jgi:hypothetical protein